MTDKDSLKDVKAVMENKEPTASNLAQTSNARVKPTLDSKFHIDYSWWDKEGRDLHAYLISHLLPEQAAAFSDTGSTDLVDWIDPDTAEVKRVDGLNLALQKAARDPRYITDHTTLVDAVFRVFLANGNKPLSPQDLGERLKRPPMTILKTLAGREVYKGLRPIN
jgi:hypothetical protein